jgi:chaperone required for assembly of F1-ATPase
MPVTRGANAAIDKVSVQKAEVVDLIAAYGESDLICYRAGEPVELIKRQRDAWDPILEWCDGTFGAPLDVAEGVMHIAQPDAAAANLKSEVSKLTAFQLAGFYDLVSMSGSLVLALAVTHDFIDVEKAWKTSRIDEDWQIEQWGEDDEASATALVKQNAFVSAAKFYKIS